MIKKILIKIIKLYQIAVSPQLGRNCRFYPSCSEYSCQAIKKYGIFKGFWLTIKRIIKCNPWNLGGVDQP